jgi:hypothetical protein
MSDLETSPDTPPESKKVHKVEEALVLARTIRQLDALKPVEAARVSVYLAQKFAHAQVNPAHS